MTSQNISANSNDMRSAGDTATGSAMEDDLFRIYAMALAVRFVITRSMRTLISILPIALVLSGCTHGQERAFDALEADNALIAGYGEIRTYRYSPRNEALARHRDWMVKTQSENKNILMISGGGGSGAFGVGVLAGWTATKTRPLFDVVTGVSTGALIAPYAFLGSAYDKTLVHLFTGGAAQKLVAFNGPFGVFGSSLLKPGPLKGHVERFITPHVLHQIAAEHRKGRRLLVLTTNLDTQRGVIWNMGAIAASGNPDALKLFRDVIVASASVPGILPPVMIQATSNGRQFQELHSDGGSTSQILTPPLLVENALFSKRPVQQKVHLYVIVNNALIPEFNVTPNRTVSSLGRAYSTFLKAQAQSELTALYNHARRTGASFHVASIEVQIPYSMLNPLDSNYMQAVYRLGYEQTISGAMWKHMPVFPLQLLQPVAR
ncbi:putative acylesterase/phospholipase RssA [Phyllobacterium ifriqiyense]|uniref:Acylesterase/phospholipase RssA n=1 Tax=Phyllobacterium ifriqiyense TaxID=314238 RepID=A0ABU0S5H7_9HYPH|nr:patatin-like phospholipase family protein [Phyllobacterium ifriqiyense]MDQ0995170.1 putative acylesterase/phospholipase RssA [Phyllobacterium ifriqiyense]